MKRTNTYLLCALLLCCTNVNDNKKEVINIKKILIGKNQYGGRINIEYSGDFGCFVESDISTTSMYVGSVNELDDKIVFIPQKECAIFVVKKVNNDSLSKKLYINSFLDEYLDVELTIEENIRHIDHSLLTSVDLKEYSPLYVRTKVAYKENIFNDSVLVDPSTSSLQINVEKYYDSIIILKDKMNIKLNFFKKDKVVFSSSWVRGNI